MIPHGHTALLPPGQLQAWRLPSPLLLAFPALAASTLLPWRGTWICALALIITLGVPHGALDVEIGRTLLRERVGPWWFSLFAVPYLLLVGLVLLAWQLAPEPALALFLAASVWHFGTEDAGVAGLPALFRGGLPIAVPVLLHPTTTAHVFSVASGVSFNQPPAWLMAGAVLWLAPAAFCLLRSSRRDLLLPVGLCAAFAALPPLTAFALYFVAVHAPAHTAALIRHPGRAPRVVNGKTAWRLAVPTTLLTIAIGAALWPFFSGELPVRLLRVTFQLLAAFTLPHMMLNAWLNWQDRWLITGNPDHGAP